MYREGRWRYIRVMASIGYARVSTREQNPDGQTDLLAAAGCEKVFVEHASGVLAKRPALDDALDYLRSGDTLVVTKLDRLGRSVRNLKEVVESLQQRGIGLKALSQGIDTTTPGGRLFFHMLAAIERITRGNFRLLERLFPQINRVLKINQLETITDDVIEAAASILVIGN